MTDIKRVRKIKKIFLRVLGIIAILQIGSYLPLWKNYILSNYINRVNANLVMGLNPQTGAGMGYLLIIVLFLIMLVFAIAIISLMFAATRNKWRKSIKIGYLLLIIFSAISVVYLLGGTFAYPSKQTNPVAIKGEMTTACLLCVAYGVLLLFAIYKRFLAKEKPFDALNFALVVAAVLAFLGGGILIPGARPIQSLVFGTAQVLPFIFLIYFEFVYRPVLLSRKEYVKSKRKRKSSTR